MIAAAIIGRPPAADADRSVLAPVHRPHAGVEGGGPDDGLEGRAGLAAGLGDAVEGAGPVVGAADHGADRAVGGQGDQSRLTCAAGAALAGQGAAHDVAGQALRARVDGDLDHQVGGAGPDPLGGLGGGGVEGPGHVALALAGQARERRRRSVEGGLHQALVDPLHLRQPAQHHPAARPGGGRVVGGRQAGGRARQGGEDGGLGKGQLLRRLAEIGLGRGGQAIGALAEIDAVQIELQHLVLGQDVLELGGERDLLHLAAQGLVGRQEEVAGQLLADGRAALDRMAGLQVDRQGAQGAARVHGAVLVEPPVLDGQEGERHMLGQFAQPRWRAMARAAAADHLAVGADEGDPGRAAQRPQRLLVGNLGQALQHQPVEGEPAAQEEVDRHHGGDGRRAPVDPARGARRRSGGFGSFVRHPATGGGTPHCSKPDHCKPRARSPIALP